LPQSIVFHEVIARNFKCDNKWSVYETPKELSMARPNLEKMTLKQLLELEVQVQEAIATTREHERTEVKKALAELAEKRGFKLQELMGGRGKGKTSVPKYANPEDSSQTWTGRGRKPNWLVAKLKKGANMSDFAI
jgi:DNA-binding protein H-NS